VRTAEQAFDAQNVVARRIDRHPLAEELRHRVDAAWIGARRSSR
jgi:hypothetical protein